jgi:CheY-like chemotaxis protein
MALPDLDRIARSLVAELPATTPRGEIIRRLRATGLSVAAATSVLAYVVATGLATEEGETIVIRRAPSVIRLESEWILIVEDDAACAASVKDILEEEGHRTVRVAHHGREALRLLARAGRPRLILLDLMMPEMDGRELLAILQEDAELKHVPVVVVSASPTPPAGVRAVRKPVRLEVLLDTIGQALGDA